MSLLGLINLGETLEISKGDIQARTKLEFIGEGHSFAVTQPTHRLAPVSFMEDEVAVFYFLRENGMYSFSATFTGRQKQDNIVLCYFVQTTAIHRSQRRDSYRLPIALDITVRRIIKDTLLQAEADRYETKSVNLSQTGILFLSTIDFQPRTQVLFNITLNPNESCVLYGSIIRSTPSLSIGEPYQVAAKFTNMKHTEEAQLGRYILNKQMVILKYQ